MIPLSYNITRQGVFGLCALKYVNSKATYQLSMSESHHFTVQQVGKRNNHDTLSYNITRQGVFGFCALKDFN